MGHTAATATPPGGVIVRKPGSHEPDGLLMETAFLPVFASLPKPTPDQEIAWSKGGQALYAAAGITTAQEGLSHRDDVDLLYRAAEGGASLIDVVAYPFILDPDAVLQAYPPSTFGKYRNRVKLGEVKITRDGSPQGRTAYFTTPYLAEGPEGQQNWRGEEPFPQETMNSWFKHVYDLGLQLLITPTAMRRSTCCSTRTLLPQPVTSNSTDAPSRSIRSSHDEISCSAISPSG